ncbi:MAG: hypothetical protein K2W85_02785 [Phycisphaerales bacterium]|nr:hypothetical protein [Phycisphaerales bacterium]
MARRTMTQGWIVLAGLAASISTGSAWAQSAQPKSTTVSEQPVVESTSPERATLLKLQRRISLKVDKTRLEDVITFIRDTTQADIEAIWTGDNTVGLDKEKLITLNINNQPALYVLEAVLEKAKVDFQENAWQMSSIGTIEIGPKEVLNKSRRVVMYDINDLLHVIPRYAEVPQIDLNTVLQSNQGGGGGSPFTGDNTNNNQNTGPDREARIRRIIDLLTSIVEPDQWADNGGEAATIREFNGVLIIKAPDYIHRQINGYPYWPSTTTKLVSGEKKRRYVTLDMDTGQATIDQIRSVPQGAVVGGQVVGAPAVPAGPKNGGQNSGGKP